MLAVDGLQKRSINLCPTILVTHIFGGYSHRERCSRTRYKNLQDKKEDTYMLGQISIHGSRISGTIRPGGRRRVQHRRIVRLWRLFSCTSRMLWGSRLVLLLTRRNRDITTLMAVNKRNSENTQGTERRSESERFSRRKLTCQHLHHRCSWKETASSQTPREARSPAESLSAGSPAPPALKKIR